LFGGSFEYRVRQSEQQLCRTLNPNDFCRKPDKLELLARSAFKFTYGNASAVMSKGFRNILDDQDDNQLELETNMEHLSIR
jgi:hypothetical protein